MATVLQLCNFLRGNFLARVDQFWISCLLQLNISMEPPRFRMPKSQPYTWFPTGEEWDTEPFRALLLYEVLYIALIIVLAPACFVLGFVIGCLLLVF
jgi:hypothetical protein